MFEIEKSFREKICVARKGTHGEIVDIRTYYLGYNGEFVPSKKGIQIPFEDLETFITDLQNMYNEI